MITIVIEAHEAFLLSFRIETFFIDWKSNKRLIAINTEILSEKYRRDKGISKRIGRR